MSANPLPILTAEEYLTMDRAAEWKSEFHDGEMYPMEAVSLKHAAISMNLAAALSLPLRSAGCIAYGSPLRLRVSPTQYVYPDVQIVCGKPQITDERSDTLMNPKVIIEILSPSTADYDHGAKFEFYRKLPSFEEYVLISQSETQIEVFTKQSGNLWSLTIINARDQAARLQSLGTEIPLADVYYGIETAP